MIQGIFRQEVAPFSLDCRQEVAPFSLEPRSNSLLSTTNPSTKSMKEEKMQPRHLSLVGACVVLSLSINACTHSNMPAGEPQLAPAVDCDTCKNATAFCENGTKTYSCPPCEFECLLPGEVPDDPDPIIALFRRASLEGTRDLGPLESGQTYPTEVEVENVDCPGRHTFEIKTQDAPWLQLSDITTLVDIPLGERKSTPVTIDLTTTRPGLFRGHLLIKCSTCPPPPKCPSNSRRVEVSVLVRPSS